MPPSDETDLHALALLRHRQARATRQLAHRVLRELAEGEPGGRELFLRQLEEVVALVLLGVACGVELEPLRSLDDPGVVSRRHPPGTEPARPLEEEVELDPGVAAGAGDRRAPGEVVVDERIDHLLAELLVHAQRVVRNAALLGDPARVSQVERSATAAVSRFLRPVPQQHRETDHRLTRVGEHPGHDRRVEAAAHRDGRESAHAVRARRRSSATSFPRRPRNASTSATEFV